MTRPPSVDAARPPRCLACDAPGAPVGAPLNLRGHGLRPRTVLVPKASTEPFGPLDTVTLLVRRYRCRPCGAVLVVQPRGLLARHTYGAAAVAAALVLWSLAGRSAHATRAVLRPGVLFGAAAAAGWASLQRWTARAPALWPRACRALPRGPPRLRAAAACAALALRCPVLHTPARDAPVLGADHAG